MQRLAEAAGMRSLSIIVTSFDTPPHNLGTKPQPPAHLATVFRVLQVKAQGPAAAVVTNVLLDHTRVERLALAKVRPKPSKGLQEQTSKKYNLHPVLLR